MIPKQRLQQIMSKYYLNGIINSVKWVLSNNNILINFVSPNKDLVGKIQANEFILKDGEVAIYDNSKLNKLVSVLNGDIFLDLIKQKNVFTKLTLTDKKFDLIYSHK